MKKLYYSRLAGFTLLELVTSMALIGIVVMLGGQIYQIFYRYQVNYSQEVDKTYDRVTLQMQIQADTREAFEFAFSTPYLTLSNRAGEPIYQYWLTDSLLLRERTESIDSFPFQGIWQFPPHLDGFQLLDTTLNIPYTFTLLPKSRVRK